MKAGRAGSVVKQSKECFNMLQLSLFKVAWMMELCQNLPMEAMPKPWTVPHTHAHLIHINTYKYTIFARGQSSFWHFWTWVTVTHAVQLWCFDKNSHDFFFPTMVFLSPWKVAANDATTMFWWPLCWYFVCSSLNSDCAEQRYHRQLQASAWEQMSRFGDGVPLDLLQDRFQRCHSKGSGTTHTFARQSQRPKDQ